jgi:hypothetical protein
MRPEHEERLAALETRPYDFARPELPGLPATPLTVREPNDRARLAGGNPFDFASWALVAALAAAAAFTFRDYGLSNDEEVQHRYGELILSYYASGFADQSLFGYKNLYLYGGLFDVVAVLLGKLLPFDIWHIRHGLCVAIGIGGIVAVWATARLVAGPRAGFLAALTLAATAQWYGAMFNHTKDIPFAAAMMGAAYFLLRAARDFPQPRWRDTLCFGLLLGAACGLRATGLLLLGYAGLVVLIGALQMRWPGALRSVVSVGLRFVPGLLLGYALMLAVWPWAALDLFNPVRALFAFAHFHYEIRTIFAGRIYEMADVPWWYAPAYLAIRLPLLMFAGAAAAAIFAALRNAWREQSAAPREIAMLWFIVLFPIACQALAAGPAFTGMRHFFFVVPPLAALAGIGLDAGLRRLGSHGRTLTVAAAAALTAVFAWEASRLVRLHPHQYLYYNALVGGLPGAAGRYSMDYWVNIMPEAVGRLEAYIDRLPAEPGRRYTVGVCGERFSFEHEANSRLQWTDGWYEADFFISPTHMNCERNTNGRVIVRIERLGVVVGVVKDRRGFPPPNAPQ